MTRQARSDHFFGSFACLTAATHSSQSPSDSSCSEPSSARFNLSRTGLGGFLAMAVLIALMPSRHSDLSSANANVPLNSRNVMAMNQSRASGRRGIAPFRVRTCFCGQWCVGVRLLGEFKNAQRILAYRRRLCCLSSVHAQFSRLPLAPVLAQYRCKSIRDTVQAKHKHIPRQRNG